MYVRQELPVNHIGPRSYQPCSYQTDSTRNTEFIKAIIGKNNKNKIIKRTYWDLYIRTVTKM